MSHLQTLADSKALCDQTGECAEYQSNLQHEYQEIDSYTASANQTTVSIGLIALMVGLFVLLTPFIKPLQNFQVKLLPKLAIITPVILGLLIGAAIGFSVAFSACYKQQCSVVESTAIITIPIASLFFSIPMARRIYRKRQAVAENLAQPKATGWVVVGGLIILGTVMWTVGGIDSANDNAEYRKTYLQTNTP